MPKFFWAFWTPVVVRRLIGAIPNSMRVPFDYAGFMHVAHPTRVELPWAMKPRKPDHRGPAGVDARAGDFNQPPSDTSIELLIRRNPVECAFALWA
jgi:hypothetical protein